MRREGLTVTMVFLAESANYGEGIGNISTLKKMSRGNHEQYSYISRQAMRYNIVRQADWDQTPVDGKSGVVQFAPSATIAEYPNHPIRYQEFFRSIGTVQSRNDIHKFLCIFYRQRIKQLILDTTQTISGRVFFCGHDRFS